MANNSLQHHGILGMKWGVRRSEAQLTRARESSSTTNTKRLKKAAEVGKAILTVDGTKRDGYQKNKISKDTKVDGHHKTKLPGEIKSAKSKENSVKSMSDTELRNRINRLQMEKQYSQLTQKEKSIGQKFVTDVLSNAAKQTATNYVAKYMTKGVDTLIKKASKK